MPRHSIQTSFNGGAISPRLFGRTDTAIYDIALQEMINFAPTVEGPALKRSGFRIAALTATGASTVIPFEYNSGQAYALEFSDYVVRFYDNNGALLTSGGSPITLAVPYTAADAPAINWQQSADVLYLTHPNYPPAKISRVGPTSFTYTVLSLSGGPFQDQNTNQGITIAATGGTTSGGVITGGTVTLTATSAIFQPGHVGGLMQLQATDFPSIPLWGVQVNCTAGNVWRWAGNIYLSEGGTNHSGSTPPTHTLGAAYDGPNANDANNQGSGQLWLYLGDAYGQVLITATGNPSGPSTTATATVVRPIPPLGSGTWRWNFGRFSAYAGWPKNVVIWNNRLVFFTDFEVIGSVVGDYLNFSALDNTGRLTADLAFRLRINGSNPINWVAVDLQLIIGTDRAEWTMGPINSQAAISATNLQLTRQSHHGSWPVRPLQINVKTLFVQRGGRKVREASFDLTQNRYVAPNLNVWCRHLTVGGLTRLAYQQESEEIVWALRADGELLMHAYSPEQQIKGWAEAPVASFGGAKAKVIDICTIPAAGGAPDTLFAIVERAGVRTMEVLGPWWIEGSAITSAQFLDGCIVYAGAPATVIGIAGTGFPAHFYGQTVSALADGYHIDGLTVANDGSVTLPGPASNVCIGLLPKAKISGLPIKLPVREGGQAELHKKRLISGLVRSLDSAGLWIGQWGRVLSELLRRAQPTIFDTPVPLFSGVSQETALGSTVATDRDGLWTIESRAALPAVVQMVRTAWNAEESD